MTGQERNAEEQESIETGALEEMQNESSRFDKAQSRFNKVFSDYLQYTHNLRAHRPKTA